MSNRAQAENYPAGEKSIVEIAVGSKDDTTMVAALKATENLP